MIMSGRFPANPISGPSDLRLKRFGVLGADDDLAKLPVLKPDAHATQCRRREYCSMATERAAAEAAAGGGYVVLREAGAGHWVVVGDVDRRPGFTARKSRIQAVRDSIGREPAENEVYAALPRSEWRVARQL
jgi:hypothetical protein